MISSSIVHHLVFPLLRVAVEVIIITELADVTHVQQVHTLPQEHEDVRRFQRDTIVHTFVVGIVVLIDVDLVDTLLVVRDIVVRLLLDTIVLDR